MVGGVHHHRQRQEARGIRMPQHDSIDPSACYPCYMPSHAHAYTLFPTPPSTGGGVEERLAHIHGVPSPHTRPVISAPTTPPGLDTPPRDTPRNPPLGPSRLSGTTHHTLSRLYPSKSPNFAEALRSALKPSYRRTTLSLPILRRTHIRTAKQRSLTVSPDSA